MSLTSLVKDEAPVTAMCLARETFAGTRIDWLMIALLVALGVSAQGLTPAFIATSAMHVTRAGHQATLLLDGRVSVTGGYDNSGTAVGHAEIFVPLLEYGPRLRAILGANGPRGRTTFGRASTRDWRCLVPLFVQSKRHCGNLRPGDRHLVADGRAADRDRDWHDSRSPERRPRARIGWQPLRHDR
jgi:hypothetical protein